MKKKIFNIIQIGDNSNRVSRAFDLFITIVIFSNILVTFLETFEQLAFLSGFFRGVEYVTVFIFCIEYILRIWTADYLYPGMTPGWARLKFLRSFDGIVDLLTTFRYFSYLDLYFSACSGLQEFFICSGSMRSMIPLT